MLPIALTSQKYNPEVPWISETSADVRFADVIVKLRHMKQVNAIYETFFSHTGRRV